MNEQRTFGFEATEDANWEILRNIQFPRGAVYGRIQQLLELIHGVAGSGYLKWSLDRIADRLHLATRTLRRTIDTAIEEGVLSSCRERRPNGQLGICWLKIFWPGVIAYRATTPTPLLPKVPATHAQRKREAATYERPKCPTSPTPVANMAPTSGQIGTDQWPIWPRNSPLSRPKKVPPPSSEADRASWEGVAVVLDDLGIGNTTSLIDDAQHRVTPDHALSLIEYWKSKRDGWEEPLGVLHWRIKQARDHKPADRGWPKGKSATTAKPSRNRAEMVQAWRYELIAKHGIGDARDFDDAEVVNAIRRVTLSSEKVKERTHVAQVR